MIAHICLILGADFFPSDFTGSIREFIEANCEDTFILQDELSGKE